MFFLLCIFIALNIYVKLSFKYFSIYHYTKVRKHINKQHTLNRKKFAARKKKEKKWKSIKRHNHKVRQVKNMSSFSTVYIKNVDAQVKKAFAQKTKELKVTQAYMFEKMWQCYMEHYKEK